MKRLGKVALACVLAAAALQPAAAAAQDGPSAYLRCDGQPNNMTDGESFARFVGAITLLGLFAPSPEAPNPAARQFGDAGVAACTSILEGENAEGNPVRRVPLFLGRALHRIEAKDYDGAIADVNLARAEAGAAGLVGNPYFDRSMGLSFNNIEAMALLRLGRPEEARAISLGAALAAPYSFLPSIYADDFFEFQDELSPEAEQRMEMASRITPTTLGELAGRLDRVGRFADSAARQEALLSFMETDDDETPRRGALNARAAVTHALAGNWERARERAARARAALELPPPAPGKTGEDPAPTSELLDLLGILEIANAGDLARARLQFGARSRWNTPSFGVLVEVNRRLREGAAPEELTGLLAQSPENMISERRDEALARREQEDGDNRTLWRMVVPYASIEDFEDRASDTHRLENSRMMSGTADTSGFHLVFASGNPITAIDSIMLHTALQARSRGKEGFTMFLVLDRGLARAFVRFVNRDEDTSGGMLFMPAEPVIAELSQVIPTRDEVRQRQRERRRLPRDQD